ncbi:hypothetical protein NDU88_004307 [Pleurodeles waltl]|uniref:Uncharacterized protein n=1 Tax=Pleurodeles waltl TaxID=8319 RepID=A0AAV7SID7_PLEWA|nr:hypothetical protein NDU88_004307 [Pleurodeles waltl]
MSDSERDTLPPAREEECPQRRMRTPMKPYRIEFFGLFGPLDGEQDGGRVTQPRSVCSDQGTLPVLRQLSRGSELPSAVALRGKQCSGILATF